MEVYYQILEELNQPLPPPPQRMPIQVRRVEPDEEVPRLKGCCCDCHRKGDRAPESVRRRIVRCDTSESDDSEFGESRLAHRARRINLISDSESSSDSDDEPVRTKKPVGRPSKKSTAVKVKKAPKEEKKKKSTVSTPKKKQTSRA